MSEAFENPLPGVPWVESPFFDRFFPEDHTDPETRRIARALHDDGFAVIDFPEPDFEAIAAQLIETQHGKFAWDDWHAEGHAAGVSLRLQDRWEEDDAVRRIASNPEMRALLTRLYGRPAFPFQTLSFPVGTQQHVHSDVVHFSCSPARFMCGVWVALEDVHEDAGPLVYYPGSHRWPIYVNEHVGQCAAELMHTPTQETFEPLWRDLIEAHGVEPRSFRAKKGQALIWAANLLHGGAPVADAARTRWSQVTHYYFDDCIYYTPMTSDPMYGSVDFRDPIDIATGEPVSLRYAGHVLPDTTRDALARQPHPLPEGFDPALYLQANPDVARAGADAEEHYRQYGIHEGRKLRP